MRQACLRNANSLMCNRLHHSANWSRAPCCRGRAATFKSGAAEHGILLTPGDCFDAPSHFRLGFAAVTGKFPQALNRLAEFVNSCSAANMAKVERSLPSSRVLKPDKERESFPTGLLARNNFPVGSSYDQNLAQPGCRVVSANA
jgi:hypothetical protein